MYPSRSSNSWYLPAFYIGNGCTLFGEDGTDEAAGVDFGGEKAVDVTNYLIDLAQNPNFKIDDGRLRYRRPARRKHQGDVLRFLGCECGIKEALGDNMGVAALPTYTLNGEEVADVRLCGIKGDRRELAEQISMDAGGRACRLARKSAEAQRLHYELRQVDAVQHGAASGRGYRFRRMNWSWRRTTTFS